MTLFDLEKDPVSQFSIDYVSKQKSLVVYAFLTMALSLTLYASYLISYEILNVNLLYVIMLPILTLFIIGIFGVVFYNKLPWVTYNACLIPLSIIILMHNDIHSDIIFVYIFIIIFQLVSSLFQSYRENELSVYENQSLIEVLLRSSDLYGNSLIPVYLKKLGEMNRRLTQEEYYIMKSHIDKLEKDYQSSVDKSHRWNSDIEIYGKPIT